MISRFIQTLVFSICTGAICFSQTNSSFYIKISDEKDIEKAQQIFSTSFATAFVSRPFLHNTFENLDHIIRIDGHSISEMDIHKVVTFQVDYIEVVPISKIYYTPNDFGVEFGSPNQWYLHKINAEAAWDFSKGNPDVVVAVVDNAFLAEHTDLINKRTINPNEIPNDGLDNDANGYIDDYDGWNSRTNSSDVFITSTNTAHGTHVAGIAAAETDNDLGMASLSFLTKWLPVRAGDDNDNITHGYEGIEFAAARGANVINCSWGSFDSSATAKSVINFALSQDCFVVASAGNFSNELPVYPAHYSGVICVAATTISDVKLNISNFGIRTNISAPGSGIWSSTYTSTAAPSYGFMSGTSMASALVSAQLGLMRGYAGEGNNAIILDCLYNTAENIDDVNGNEAYDSLLGRGRIDAERAMQCLQSILHLNVDENEASMFAIYPNPSSEYFFIASHTTGMSEHTNLTWRITDLGGKEIMQGQGQSGNINQLSPGIYFISITDKKQNKQSTLKLIKN